MRCCSASAVGAQVVAWEHQRRFSGRYLKKLRKLAERAPAIASRGAQCARADIEASAPKPRSLRIPTRLITTSFRGSASLNCVRSTHRSFQRQGRGAPESACWFRFATTTVKRATVLIRRATNRVPKKSRAASHDMDCARIGSANLNQLSDGAAPDIEPKPLALFRASLNAFRCSRPACGPHPTSNRWRAGHFETTGMPSDGLHTTQAGKGHRAIRPFFQSRRISTALAVSIWVKCDEGDKRVDTLEHCRSSKPGDLVPCRRRASIQMVCAARLRI